MSINAPRSRTIVLTDAGTSPFSAALVDYDGTIGGGTPIPAPVFTTPSSIAADGTPQVGELLTGIDGVASDTTSYTRRWLLGSTVLTSSAAYTPSAVGTYRYETIATGPGGETTSGSNITVAAATVPAPTLSQPSISPASGAVGTTFTATDGAVTNGTITGRRWLLGATAIGTGTTVTPNAAGSLTRENTAVGTNGETITSTSTAVTVSAATPAPAPSLSLSSAVAKAEGNSGTTLFSWILTLNRDGSTAAYPFTWSTAGSGANPADAADFGGAFPSGSGTFASGETSKTISVLVAGDTAFEPDDTFTLTVVATGLNTVTSTGTISNDDAAPATPTVSISAAQSKSEGNSGATLFTYTVTRSSSSGAVNVPWTFAAGGTLAADFTGGTLPAGGTVAMADGAATGTFTISVNGDTAIESDETFTVLIAAPSGYALGSPSSATGTIVNDDVAVAVDRIAAYGTSIPTIANNKKGGRLQRCTRKTVVIGADVPYITGTFDNYAAQASGDTAVGASVTILQHAVINPDGSRSKIATFDNGASTTKLLGTDAATGIRIFHDKIYPADVFGPGVTMFRRGDRITLQTDALVSNDQTAADMCYNCEVAPIGDSSIEFDATGVPVAPGVGTIAPQTNQTSSNSGYTVSCIYGPHNDVAHINFGDSIAAGTGDNATSPIRWGYARAATNSYLTNPVPMLSLARHGTVMNDLFNTDLSVKSTGVLRMAYVVSGTFQQVSENWAANDLGQTPAQSTYDLTVANKARLYQILRARGCQWITSVAPTPRTTNGTTNTPTNSGWALGGFADQLNQYLAARLADGTINGLVRSLALRLSTDPTSADYFLYKNMDFSLDGTHFQPTGYLAVIPEHRVAVLRGNTAGDEPSYTTGQIVLDTFTTGVGGSVADRPTDSGATWARQGTADLTVTAEGRAYARVNGPLSLKDTRMGRHQYVERDTVIVTSTSTVQNLQTRRQSPADTFGGYNVSFNTSTLVVALFRIPNTGTSTQLATATLTDTAGLYSTVGSQYTMRMESNGPYHSVYMGPKGGPLTLVLQANDAIYMLGDVGVRDNNNATATVGRHIDEVRAGNLTPAVL